MILIETGARIRDQAIQVRIVLPWTKVYGCWLEAGTKQAQNLEGKT